MKPKAIDMAVDQKIAHIKNTYFNRKANFLLSKNKIFFSSKCGSYKFFYNADNDLNGFHSPYFFSYH